MQGKVFLKMDDKTKEAWGKQHLLSKAQVEEDQKKTAKASLKGRKQPENGNHGFQAALARAANGIPVFFLP